MADTLVNRVANSGIVTYNLEEDYPTTEILEIDIKDFLFHGLLLKEIEFRQKLKEVDWQSYQKKIVTIHCSTDAILPVWSFMLFSQYLEGIAADIYIGTKESYLVHYYEKTIADKDFSNLTDKKVVIKGCGEKPVPPAAYAFITTKLKPIVSSLMYGEPCSTVPIYKKPK